MSILKKLRNQAVQSSEGDFPLRFPFFVSACLLSFVLMMGFGILNIVNFGIQKAAPGIGTGFVIAGMLVASLKMKKKHVIYFAGNLFVDVFLIYLVTVGGANGSLLYWIFAMPIISYFLLGKNLGSVAALFGFLGTLTVLVFPDTFMRETAPVFEVVAIVRFSATYVLTGILSFVYEMMRERQALNAKDRLEKLEAANAYIANLSITDSLTGCYNRLHFDDVFPGEIKKAVRYNLPLSLVICDIDHFKNINDNYGHQVGDVVLSEVAGVLINSVRADIDWVSRCGGEEFAIVLPNTGVQGAAVLADRIREKIADMSVEVADTAVSVTASFGVSEVSSPEDTPAEMYRRSDRRLYMAKEQGRNAVVARGPEA